MTANGLPAKYKSQRQGGGPLGLRQTSAGGPSLPRGIHARGPSFCALPLPPPLLSHICFRGLDSARLVFLPSPSSHSHKSAPRYPGQYHPSNLGPPCHRALTMGGKGRNPKSHGQTACLPCRRRKSRCKYEPGSQACLMCRAHEVECVPVPRSGPHPLPPRAPRTRARATPRARLSFAENDECASGQDTQPTAHSSSSTEPHRTTNVLRSVQLGDLVHPHFMGAATSTRLTSPPTSTNQPLPLDEAEDDSPHIMGPAVASDKHFLEDYLSTTQTGSNGKTIRPVLPGLASSPVVFTKVQKRPLGTARHVSVSRAKLQMVEKLLEPHLEQVLNM